MSDEVTSAVWGKKAAPRGQTPAIALVEPKYPHNVGMVVRLASCYGLRQVWFTGDRVSLNPPRGERLPREERMKGYRDVQMIHYEHLFDQFPADAVPVAVEVRPIRRLLVPVSLRVIKDDAELSGWELVRLPRLSIVPVSVDQWRRVEELSRDGEPKPRKQGSAK